MGEVLEGVAVEEGGIGLEEELGMLEGVVIGYRGMGGGQGGEVIGVSKGLFLMAKDHS